MRRSVTLPLMCAAWAFVACAPAGPPEAEVDIAAETAALRAAAEHYHQLAAAGDAEGLAGLYMANSVSFPPGEAAVEGMASMRDYAEAFSSLEELTATFTLHDVVVGAGGDMGYTVADGVLTFMGPDGEPVTESVRDIHVWRKDPTGAWRLAIDIWNSGEAPEGM